MFVFILFSEIRKTIILKKLNMNVSRTRSDSNTILLGDSFFRILLIDNRTIDSF